MNKFIKLIAAIIVAPLAIVLGSCNNDAGNDIPTEYFQAFVTLKSITPEGTSFEAQKDFDSDPVTFTSTIKLDPSNVEIGQRYIIAYMTSDGQPYTAGAIQLYNIFGIYTGEAAVTTDKVIEGSTFDINSTVVNVTGQYLNVSLMGAVNQLPRVFTAYILDTSLDSAYPDVYVAFKTDNAMGPERTYFGSFDLKKVFESPTAKGLTVHYQYRGENKTYTVTFKPDIAPAE